MAEVNLPLVGPSNNALGDIQRSINLYPRKGNGPGEKPCLASTPGLSTFASLSDSPVRGMLVMGSRLFVVAGVSVIELTSSGTATTWGRINTARGRVSMAFLGDILVIGDGDLFYGLNLGATISASIAAGTLGPIPDAPKGRVCIQFNQRILYQEKDSGRVYYSELNDATNIPELNFFTAENQPDNLTTMVPTEDQVWLLGLDTTEVWSDVGERDNPFQRIPGAVVANGCTHVDTALKADNSVLWVGRNAEGEGQVFRSAGFQHVIVSTAAVSVFLKSATNLSAYSYQEDNATHYVLNADSGTWALDLSTGQWHERASLDASGLLTRSRANIHAACFGKHLVADKSAATIWEQSSSIYADGSSPLVRRRVFRGPASGQDVSIDALHIDAETGVGLITGQGSDPQMVIRTSVDGGEVWSHELWEDMGEIGDRQQKVRVRRLGLGSDWAFEVSVSDPVPVRLYGASAEVRAGRR